MPRHHSTEIGGSQEHEPGSPDELFERVIKTGHYEPFLIAVEIGQRGWEREQYDRMAELVEVEALKNVKLLEDFQLLLRGDHLPIDQVHKFGRHSIEVKPAAVNNRHRLNTQLKRFAALGALGVEILNRVKISRGYEQESLGPDRIPVILYSFAKFYDNFKFQDTQDFSHYFVGQADDIGSTFSGVYTIQLPEKDREQLWYKQPKLELITTTEITESDIKRTRRLHHAGSMAQTHFIHMKNWLAALLASNRILKQLEGSKEGIHEGAKLGDLDRFIRGSDEYD